MSYPLKVHIIRNSTGEERVYVHDYPQATGPWDDEMDDYLWTEGNYGCDCNRASFFAEAGKEEGAEDFPCGEGAYSIPYLELPDGRKVEIDRHV